MHSYLNTKYYFINKLDTKNIDKLDKQTIVIYRNYSSKRAKENLLIEIKNYCQKRRLKIILSNNIKLAIKLKFDGVYIPSFNTNFNHLNYSLFKKFRIIGSAHTILKKSELKSSKKLKIFFCHHYLRKTKTI